jgi:hypothetical protein
VFSPKAPVRFWPVGFRTLKQAAKFPEMPHWLTTAIDSYLSPSPVTSVSLKKPNHSITQNPFLIGMGYKKSVYGCFYFYKKTYFYDNFFQDLFVFPGFQGNTGSSSAWFTVISVISSKYT